ncbi:MAG: hypothetical protein R3C01_04530 [Planctomycetaceae bacterium]
MIHTFLRRYAVGAGLALWLGVSQVATVFGHPGHGEVAADSPAHYIVEPWHAVPVLLAVIAVAVFVRWMRTDSGTASQTTNERTDA